MVIDIDNMFAHSFVISINTDRYKIFCDRFNAYQLNTPLPRLFNGFTIPNGIYQETGFIKTKHDINCCIGHIAIIKMAQSLDWQFVCIFEDDAYPCINARDKLFKVFNNLPDDIDLLKMGHLGNLSNPSIYNNMFQKVKTYGSHAYIVFKKYYQTYIDLTNKDIHIDRLAMNTGNNSLILATKNMIFMQNDIYMNDTLHNNNRYLQLLKAQGYLKNFKLNET